MNPRPSTKKSQSNSSDESHEQQQELFPIVGVGASAGGLEAFTG
jgi:two-component system CheB/CheR fusion protein